MITTTKTNEPQRKSKKDNLTAIKVTIHIPDNVRNKQEKINRIYNILKPTQAAKPTQTA